MSAFQVELDELYRFQGSPFETEPPIPEKNAKKQRKIVVCPEVSHIQQIGDAGDA
jgi:hypothetical protein